MTEKIFVKPKDGLLVRKEDMNQYKEEGELVKKSKHVRRLLKFGDLIETKQPRKTKKEVN